MSAGRTGRRSPLAAFLLGLGAAAALGAAVLAGLWVSLPDVSWLASGNPRTTALIEQRRREARRAGRPRPPPDLRFVPLDRVAPRLAEAVVLSEDAAFFGHAGFDIREIRKALTESIEKGHLGRGASTITQQLAKNLFLGTERTLTRKLEEAVLAAKLERALGKRRILTLYLNAAEWGDGVFGVEAAARVRFGVSPANLTTAQAAVLAAMLPAPRRASLAHPAPWLRRRSRRVVDLLLRYGAIDPDEHQHASAELERILMGPPPPEDVSAEPPEEEEGEEVPGASAPGPSPPAASAPDIRAPGPSPPAASAPDIRAPGAPADDEARDGG